MFPWTNLILPSIINSHKFLKYQLIQTLCVNIYQRKNLEMKQ